MPTILLINGCRFHFNATDKNEPCHIHVSKADGYAKVWLEPDLESAYFYNYKSQEKREILSIIEDNQQFIKNKWYEYFEK